MSESRVDGNGSAELSENGAPGGPSADIPGHEFVARLRSGVAVRDVITGIVASLLTTAVLAVIAAVEPTAWRFSVLAALALAIARSTARLYCAKRSPNWVGGLAWTLFISHTVFRVLLFGVVFWPPDWSGRLENGIGIALAAGGCLGVIRDWVGGHRKVPRLFELTEISNLATHAAESGHHQRLARCLTVQLGDRFVWPTLSNVGIWLLLGSLITGAGATTARDRVLNPPPSSEQSIESPDAQPLGQDAVVRKRSQLGPIRWDIESLLAEDPDDAFSCAESSPVSAPIAAIAASVSDDPLSPSGVCIGSVLIAETSQAVLVQLVGPTTSYGLDRRAILITRSSATMLDTNSAAVLAAEFPDVDLVWSSPPLDTGYGKLIILQLGDESFRLLDRSVFSEQVTLFGELESCVAMEFAVMHHAVITNLIWEDLDGDGSDSLTIKVGDLTNHQHSNRPRLVVDEPTCASPRDAEVVAKFLKIYQDLSEQIRADVEGG